MSMLSGIAVTARSPMDVSLQQATPVFGEVVQALNKKAPGSTELTIDLGHDLQMPIDASVHVPVTAVTLHIEDERCFHLTLAPRSRDYYPHFHGTLTLESEGEAQSAIVLAGEYTAPFGEIGKAIDLTFLRGAAASSLQRFTDRLAAEIVQRASQVKESA